MDQPPLTWAGALPELSVGIVILGAAGLIGLGFGLCSARACWRSWAPGCALLVASAWGLLPNLPLGIRVGGLVVASGALVVEICTSKREENGREPARTTRYSWAAPVAAATGTAGLLLPALGSFAGSVLVWEWGTVLHYEEAVQAGQTPFGLLRNALLWQDGLVSTGNDSLLYGVPTYALLLTGFNPLHLRLVAAVFGILIPVLGWWIGRRFLGETTGAVLAILLAFNPCLVFYGHYGTSLTATVFCSLAAMGSVWALLVSEGRAFLRALLAAAVLFVTTLHYATARVLVVFLVVFAPVAALLAARRRGIRTAAAAGGLVALAALVWHIEGRFGHKESFFRASGEQLLFFVKHSDYVNQYLGRAVPPESLTVAEKVELALNVGQRTYPQMLEVIAPRLVPATHGLLFGADPPPVPLYLASLAPFIVWGFALSFRRLPFPVSASLALGFLTLFGALLMTSRVDSPRSSLFALFFSIWSALGLVEGWRVLRTAGVPRLLAIGLGALFLVTAPAHAVHLFTGAPPRDTAYVTSILKEMENERGPVLYFHYADARETGFMVLGALEQMRRSGAPRILLEAGFVSRLLSAAQSGRELANDLRQEVQQARLKGTLILSPSEALEPLVPFLLQAGIPVERRGPPPFGAYWIRRASPDS